MRKYALHLMTGVDRKTRIVRVGRAGVDEQTFAH